jgi:phosphate transport system substrate-binding protein
MSVWCLVRWVSRAVLAAVLLAVAASCVTPTGRHAVRIRGSDTMLELNRRLAEAYMRAHEGVAIVVEGGGTRSGVEALVAGEVDLCAASRPFSPTEIAAIHQGSGTLGVRFLVARDALSIYLNPANPIRNLSSDDLAAIFDGSFSRWSEVGGDEVEIVVVIRPHTSGSHRFLRDHLLGGGSFPPGAVVVARTSDVVERVAAAPGAIGFGGVAQGRDLIHCAVDGAEPTAGEVREGRYPLARYLYLYSARPPAGVVRQFLDWCLGPDGQAVVEEVGFIALWVD